MSNVSVYNMEGNEVGTLELNDAVFGVEVNEHLVHMAVVRQLAHNCHMNKMFIYFYTEHSVVQFQCANFIAFHIINRYV